MNLKGRERGLTSGGGRGINLKGKGEGMNFKGRERG